MDLAGFWTNSAPSASSSLMLPTDSDLLARWRDGDRPSGAMLFQRHYAAIARFFHNKVDDGARDELVQRVFLGCLENLRRFRGEASFKTYLFGIAHHVLGDHLRTRARKGRREDPVVDVDNMSVHDLGQSPERPMVERQEQRILLEALRRIPLCHQVALELHYWEQLTAAEIGVALGIPLGTAKTRLREGRQALEIAISRIDASGESLQSTLDDLEQWATRVRPRLEKTRAERPSTTEAEQPLQRAS